MKSLDTNVLIYAANSGCVEHDRAAALLHTALQHPADWILADQILFEFYKALRNPKILARPLDAPKAAARVLFLREESGFAHCVYEASLFDTVAARLRDRNFPYQRTHDLLLTATLESSGVKTFYTRNTKDFADAAFAVENPID